MTDYAKRIEELAGYWDLDVACYELETLARALLKERDELRAENRAQLKALNTMGASLGYCDPSGH